jgi:dTMP kinase
MPDSGLVKPDLTFFIDANAETISLRSNYGQERYERVEFQKKVSESYGKLRELARDDSHWVTVDAGADKTKEDLHQEILERVVKYQQDELDQIDLKKLANALFVAST